MNILITGGTGLIGRYFIEKYHHDYRFTVITRNINHAQKILPANCEFIDDLQSLTDLSAFNAVINLAGEPIVDKRWTSKQKSIIEQIFRYAATNSICYLLCYPHDHPVG